MILTKTSLDNTEIVTADDTLTAHESGTIYLFDQVNATAHVDLTLPENPPIGTWYTFTCWTNDPNNYRLRIDPGLGAIRDDSGYTSDKYKWADAAGETITLIAGAENASGHTDWFTLAKTGVWSEEL